MGINGVNTDENRKTFEKLQEYKSELDSKFPELEWYDNPGNKSKSINYYSNEEYDFSEEKRKDTMEWLSKNMKIFETRLWETGIIDGLQDTCGIKVHNELLARLPAGFVDGHEPVDILARSPDQCQAHC